MDMLNERIEKLVKERERLVNELKGLREQLTGFRVHNGGGEFSEVEDVETLRIIARFESAISALDTIIESAKGIVATDKDTIEVGSTFKFTLNNGYSNTVTLVHNLSQVDSPQDFITTKSPIGAAVLGKKEGEEFGYTVIDARTKVQTSLTGTINEIYKKDMGTSKIKK